MPTNFEPSLVGGNHLKPLCDSSASFNISSLRTEPYPRVQLDILSCVAGIIGQTQGFLGMCFRAKRELAELGRVKCHSFIMSSYLDLCDRYIALASFLEVKRTHYLKFQLFALPTRHQQISRRDVASSAIQVFGIEKLMRKRPSIECVISNTRKQIFTENEAFYKERRKYSTLKEVDVDSIVKPKIVIPSKQVQYKRKPSNFANKVRGLVKAIARHIRDVEVLGTRFIILTQELQALLRRNMNSNNAIALKRRSLMSRKPTSLIVPKTYLADLQITLFHLSNHVTRLKGFCYELYVKRSADVFTSKLRETDVKSYLLRSLHRQRRRKRTHKLH